MKFLVSFILLLCAYGIVAPPVNEKKKDKEHEETNEVDPQALDVEYQRYLHEVVNVLENDEAFRERLVKADPEDVKNGKIAKELEFASHNVRTKLDELKRQELERLRHAAIQNYEQTNGIDRKHMKMPGHLDVKNPLTFETEDLRKLIVHTANELDKQDKQRKEEFKEYEMRKELEYQEQLKHLDEKNREEAKKQHEEQQKKHKEHKPLHHPGSKQQYEEVWEEQDHLAPEDFNPKTFFHLHDLDGNGVWDINEVKALFRKELDKMYDPNAPEDDIRERVEEMERMREHVFSESDTNKDNLISYEEFLAQTKKAEFERDEGWKGLDEQPPYNPEEYQQYAKQHEDEIRKMIDQGLIPPAPPGYVPLVIPPGHHPPQMQGQPQMHQPVYHPPQHMDGQQGQFHPPQYQQQQFQAYNPNDPNHHQQQQFAQHQQQQQYQVPVQQHYQGQQQPPVQTHQQVPAQQQYHAQQQVPAQQQYHAQQQVPAQQQYHAQQQVPAQQQYHAPQQVPVQGNQQIPVQHQANPAPVQQQEYHAPVQQQYQAQHHDSQQAAPHQHNTNQQQAPPVQQHQDSQNHAVPVPANPQHNVHAVDSSTHSNAVPQAPAGSHSQNQPSH